MRLIFGVPKAYLFSQGEKHQWQKHNTSPGISLGVAIGLVLAILMDFLFIPVTRVSGFDFKVLNSFYVFFLVIIVHEFLHLIILPNSGNTVMGFSLKKSIFFISTNVVLSKNRLLAVTITPFVLLTIVPYSLLFVFESHILAYVAIYNAVGSGLDILSFFYFMRQSNEKYYRFVGMDLYSKIK